MMLVDIGFPGTHTIIADLVHVFIEKQAQADSGQGFNLRVFDGMNVKKNAAIRKYGNSIAYPENRLNRHGGNRLADLNRYRDVCAVYVSVRRIRQRNFVSPGHGMIKPFLFPFVSKRRVIVCRGSPQVEICRPVKQLTRPNFQGGEKTGEGIQLIDEINSLEQQKPAVFPDPYPGACAGCRQDICGGCRSGFCRGYSDFIKTKFMTGRKPAPVLIKGISNGKEAPSFIRYGKGKRDFYFAVRRDGRKRTWL